MSTSVTQQRVELVRISHLPKWRLCGYSTYPMNDLIYEQWHFSRPKLAQSYLTLLRDGSGDPICLQAPRRLGKTTFLLTEVIPAAIKDGYLPVYVDVWQHRSDPLAAINYGLQEAIDNLEVPDSTLGRRLKTKVNKVGIGAASIDLGEEPSRHRPESPFLLVDFLLKSLVRIAKIPVLLLLDEIQELAIMKDGEAIVSALRSAITKSKRSVRVIFTGSNQDRLRELFSQSRAALYEGASMLAFPALGEEFAQFVAARIRENLRREVRASDVSLAFERFQNQPRLLIDLVFVFASGDTTSFKEVLERHVDRIISDSSFQPILDRMTQLQRLVCQRLIAAADLTSADARKGYAMALRKKAVPSGTVGVALRALVDLHVLTKPSGARGHYAFDDPMFREWFTKALLT
jgi:hypothetical protein